MENEVIPQQTFEESVTKNIKSNTALTIMTTAKTNTEKNRNKSIKK
jgi:hypothetical protein